MQFERDLADNAICIVGAGALTAVGRGLLASGAAVHAGIAGFSEHPYMIDKHGESMIVARAKWLAEDLSVENRIVALAVECAQEALAPAFSTGLSLDQLAFRGHLALSTENLPDATRRQDVLERIVAGLGISILSTECIAEGHAGSLLALANACADLRDRKAHFCLVGGADSWLASERLEALDAAGRLHSVNHSWGFIPGEGAGLCLVTTAARAKQYGLVPLAEVLNVATTRETKLMGTDTICLGEGLTEAFRQVLDSRYKVSRSYCDLNGETYRADEYGFTICRTSEYFEDAGKFTAAAECWGDVGAASGVLALVLSVASSAWGHTNRSVALTCASSAQQPLRGAVLTSRCSAITK
ncbi:MAG: hypothetical protein IPM54_06305 [Polyangiaceae bacterium]|nr:hypothetical protein [Polyangiaceae bacterium]